MTIISTINHTSNPYPTNQALRDNDTRNTVHQRVWQQGLGKTVNENKILSGLTLTGAGVAMIGAGDQSRVFSMVAEKGIVPMVGGAMAGLGLAACQDAMVNDCRTNRINAGSKIALGTLTSLIGTEVLGRSYNIPVARQALTGTLEHIGDNGQSYAGASIMLAGLAASKTATATATETLQNPENKPLNLAKTLAASTGASLSLLGGAQMIAEEQDIEFAKDALTNALTNLSQSNALLGVTGLALTGGALMSANKAITTLKNRDNAFLSAALGNGALAGVLGGLELMGRAANLEQAHNLFLDNAQWLTGISASTAGLAWLSNAHDRINLPSLTGLQGLEVTGGAFTAVSGIAFACDSVNETLSNQLFNGAELAASAGLALAAAGFALQMHSGVVAHKPEAAVFNACMGTLSVVASLLAFGAATDSPFVENLSDTIQSHTIEPLINHAIRPALEYLYNNPIAGSLTILAISGAMLHLRGRHAENLYSD